MNSNELEKKIPKIIHYCWFGRSKKNNNILKCIDTWKRILPDYQIIEWNESNFDTSYNEYVKEAYESKKYAFVSDVARLYALYNYGGIYFDTDIEVLTNIDPYLDSSMVLAFESESMLMSAFIATEKNNNTIKEFLEIYSSMNFLQEDGSFNIIANTVYLTELMEKNGLVLNNKKQILLDGTVVYPMDIFGAFDADNSCFVISNKTVLVHRCAASWADNKFRIIFKIKRTISVILGEKRYKQVRVWFKNFKRSEREL